MTIYPVTASEFAPYGRVITGYETECEAVVAALSASTPLPEGTDYLAEDPALQNLPESAALGASLFGGIPDGLVQRPQHQAELPGIPS